MKHWLNKNFKTLIVAAFLIPIVTVAIVSISHVTKWYGISNPVSWAVYLSIGIEIAALSALAAISANMGKKVYFPFAVVTLIQFIGNVFFAYTYIDINGQSFKDWVDLVSPLTELMGIDPTDLVGNKRFLAFFAGGMLPIISLSFLHMLVKFTEEDRLKETLPIKESESNPEELKDFVDETTRLHLSENDLKVLEDALLNPKEPNENLKRAAEEYKRRGELLAEIMKDDQELGLYNEPFDNPSVKPQLTREERGEILAEMMKNDQELGLYDEPFENPLVKEPSVTPQNASGMMITTNEDIIESIPSDDEISDWDITLMDGLEDEKPFFTEEEIENILQEEPTEEEIQRNFSTIEPETENIFQDDGFNQEHEPESFMIPEEEQTFGLDIKQLNETFEEVNKEIDIKVEDTSPIESDEKKKY